MNDIEGAGSPPRVAGEYLAPCRYPPSRPAVFIAAPHYRGHRYGPNHPLSIPRVSLTFDLINAYGALTAEEYMEGRPATPEELVRFHTPAFVDAMQRSETQGFVAESDRRRHGIGTLENPWFDGFFRIPALATGSSLLGVEQVLAGRNAFSPAGGMHHAEPDRARGFCFFNDAVLACQRLEQAGCRVLYLDLDAHHGDAVERAFADDPAVFTLSFHMDTRYAYPYTGGTVTDFGRARGEYACLNVPLPPQTHDAEYRFLFEAIWPQVLDSFRPDAVVLQAGTDALFADPLGKLCLSTETFLDIVARVARDAPRLLVLGGGGYHPLCVARCWTGVWAVLSGRRLPAEIPPAGRALLAAVGGARDEDEPRFTDLCRTREDRLPPRPVRAQIHTLLDTIRRTHPRLRDC